MTTGKSTKTEFEKSVEVVTSLAKEFEARSANTGISYFKGKNRLCKVLNSKKGVRIEVNVTVPKAVEAKFKMEPISIETAKKKHLGSMKYSVVTLDDSGVVKEFIGHLLSSFKATFEVAAEPNKKVDLEKKAK